MSTINQTAAEIAAADVTKHEAQVRMQLQAAQAAFRESNLDHCRGYLVEARRAAAAANRAAKRAGDPKSASHAQWMKNCIASMVKLLERRIA